MDELHLFVRPGAGNGGWLAYLIPAAYLINYYKHSGVGLTFQYQLSTILVLGLAGRSAFIFHELNEIGNVWKTLTKRALLATGISFLVWMCLKQSIPFAAFCGFTTTISYEWILWHFMKSLPKSFTLGEASIVAQGFVLLTFNTFLRLVDYANHIPSTDMQKMTTIVQITLLGVSVIVALVHLIRIFQSILFYPLCAAVAGVVMVFPLAEDMVIVTLIKFVFGDWERVFVTLIALGLLGITSSGVVWFVSHRRQSSTSVRKYFHVLIVLVFVPGLIYQCTLLFVAAGMLLSVFVLLETARIIKLWPVSGLLESAVSTFLDAQDSGTVALTPIYLLSGCALPMWLHPCPCDLTDSAGFNLVQLLSGVLSVGIGDAAASVFGSMVGQHKWKEGGAKSIEGTFCAILAQAIVLPLLIAVGLFKASPLRVAAFVVAIVTNSLVEAKTDQIDNLVLPLVTYNILSLC